MQSRRDSGDQRAAADGDEDIRHPGARVGGEFEADRALSGDDDRVVEGVDQAQSVGLELGHERERAVHRVRQPYRRAGRLGDLDGSRGRRLRHDDGRLHAQRLGHDRDGDGVVPAAHRHHPGRAVGLAQRQELRRRPARLEGAGALQQFQLGGDGNPEQRRQSGALDRRRTHDMSGDQSRRRFDVRDADQDTYLLLAAGCRRLWRDRTEGRPPARTGPG